MYAIASSIDSIRLPRANNIIGSFMGEKPTN